MFDTQLSKAFNLKTPIINAGMAFVAGPELRRPLPTPADLACWAEPWFRQKACA